MRRHTKSYLAFVLFSLRMLMVVSASVSLGLNNSMSRNYGNISQETQSVPPTPLHLFIHILANNFPSMPLQIIIFFDDDHFRKEFQQATSSIVHSHRNFQFATMKLNHENIIRFATSFRLKDTSSETEFHNLNPNLYFVILVLQREEIQPFADSENSSRLVSEEKIDFLLAHVKKWKVKFILFDSDDLSLSNGSGAYLFHRKNIQLLNTTIWIDHLELDSNFYIFQQVNSKVIRTNEEDGNQTILEMQFMELYTIKDRKFTKMRTFSIWNLYSMFSPTIDRKNFHGVQIRGVAQQFPGLEWGNDIEVNEDTQEVTFKSGYFVEEFHYMRDALNFTPVYVQGLGFTRAFTNSVIVGMGCQLEKGLADIAITSSEMTTLRFQHIAFLHPTFPERLYLYFKQLPSSYMRNMYAEAFTREIWLAVVATILILIMTIFAISSVKIKLGEIKPVDRNFTKDSSLWAIGIFCQQGWHFSPDAIPLKIVVVSGLILALIIYTAYSASLVSLLSITFQPVRSLEEAIMNQFQLYAESHTISARYVLNDLKDAGKIPKTTVNLTDEIDAVQAYNKIMGTKSGIITPHLSFIPNLEKFMGENISSAICDCLTYVPIRQNPQHSCMTVAKNSPYKEQFNFVILQLLEKGIRYQLFKRNIFQKRLECMDRKTRTLTQIDPMEFDDIYPAICLLISSFIICTALLGVEILIVKHRIFGRGKNSPKATSVYIGKDNTLNYEYGKSRKDSFRY